MSIREDGAVEAIDDAANYRRRHFLKDFNLSTVWPKYSIECKVVCTRHIADFALGLAVDGNVDIIIGYASLVVAALLDGILRSNSADDLYSIPHVHFCIILIDY